MMPRNWQLNLVLITQFTTIMALDICNPYWPLIFHYYDNSLTPHQVQYWSAAIYVLPLLATIITSPYWGRLGGEIGHKKMLLRASIAVAITQIIIGFVTHPPLILAIRVVQGIFTGFTVASQAWSITMSHSDSHSHVIGRIQAASALGTIVGPLIGGVLAHYFNFATLFFVSGAICFIVVIILAIYLQESPIKEMMHEKIEKFSHVKQTIIFLLFVICVAMAARWMNSSFFALYATQRLGGGTLTVGLLFSTIALTLFLSAPRWGAFIDKKIEKPSWILSVLACVLLGAGFAQYIFAFTSSIYVALCAALLWGICLGAIFLIPFTLLIRESSEHYKGSIIGFGNSANKLGNLMGVGIGAVVQAATNFTFSFMVIGFIYGILGIIVLIIATTYFNSRSFYKDFY